MEQSGRSSTEAPIQTGPPGDVATPNASALHTAFDPDQAADEYNFDTNLDGFLMDALAMQALDQANEEWWQPLLLQQPQQGVAANQVRMKKPPIAG